MKDVMSQLGITEVFYLGRYNGHAYMAAVRSIWLSLRALTGWAPAGCDINYQSMSTSQHKFAINNVVYPKLSYTSTQHILTRTTKLGMHAI